MLIAARVREPKVLSKTAKVGIFDIFALTRHSSRVVEHWRRGLVTLLSNSAALKSLPRFHVRHLDRADVAGCFYRCQILITSWLPGFARASPSLLLPPHSLLLSTLPPSDYPASPRIFAV